MSTEVFARMQQRYDTAANWTTENPILLDGEIGIESDTNKFKFGDGVLAWNALPYASSEGTTINSIDDIADVDIAAETGAVDGTALVFANGKWQAGPVIGGINYAVGSDPHYDKVVALLRMDGANNATTFTDLSKYNRTFTSSGAITSTNEFKFGSSSAYFNGSARITTDANYTTFPEFDLRTPSVAAAITVECWVRFTSTPTSSAFGIFSILSSTGSWPYALIMRQSDTSLFFGGYRDGSTDQFYVAHNWVPNLNQWYHIVGMTGSQAMYLYIDGVQVASRWNSGFGTIYGLRSQTTDLLQIGDQGGNPNMVGYIDDFRLTIGVSRYGSSYTVPTATYPASGPVDIPYVIGNLEDVDTKTAAPTNGQVFTWNSSVNKWRPKTYSIDDLSDVNTVSPAPASGNVLAWDSTTSNWKPTGLSSYSISGLSDVGLSGQILEKGQSLVWNGFKWIAGAKVFGFTDQGVDPFFSQTVAAFNFNEGVGQGIVDKSAQKVTAWTLNSTAALTNAQAKFPTSSLDISGGKNFTANTPSALNSTNLDRTWEVFLYITTAPPTTVANQRLVTYRNGTTDISPLTIGNNREFRVLNGNTIGGTHQTAIPLNQWVHLAACYNASTQTITLHLNGVRGNTSYSNAGLLFDNLTTVSLGSSANPTSTYLAGFRDTVGVNRYGSLATFTPPENPYVEGSGANPYSINGLDDVDTASTAPTNGQVLTWNGTNWVPGAAGGAPASIDALTDVDTTTSAPANGQVLTWDSAAQQWKPLATPKTIASQGDYNLRLQPNATSGRWNTQVFSGYPGTGQFRVISTNRVWVAYSDSLGNNLTNTFNSVFANSSAVVTVWLSSDGVNWSQRSAQYNSLDSNFAYLDLQILSPFTFGSTVYLSTSDPSAGPATIALANRNVLAYNSATQKWEPTPINADFLSDVDTTTAAPTNGQALVWNGTNWVPGSISAPAASIDSLTDVDTSTVAPTDGQTLAWNQTAGKWRPSDNVNEGALNSVPNPAYANSQRVENCMYIPQSTWNTITSPATRTLYIVTPTIEGGAASLYYYPSSISDLPPIGEFFLGGYYGGVWSQNADGIATHALIVSPRPNGQSSGDWSTVSSFVTTTNTNGLNGYSDWIIPTRNELDILYDNLKPSTAPNNTGYYINPNSVPPRTANRTATVPGRTSVLIFHSNGGFQSSEGQDFPQTPTWSSTNSSFGKWCVDFNGGVHSDLNLTQAKPVRLIRRVVL